MKSQRTTMLDRLDEQHKQIQMICCNYFERYDKELNEVKDGLTANGDKYHYWVKKLIEPSSFNDARLFALETRFQEEEEMRFQ